MTITKKKLSINSKFYEKLLTLLNVYGQSRLVGGCVRDALLGKISYDIDIATALTPNEVIRILTNQQIKTIPTGIQYGTVTAVIENEKFEITTLRSDLNCKGRHTQVAFTKDFKIDAERRDFTINAISYCPLNNEIYDYFDGISDLEQSKVVFIGNPLKRIREDYLRILRFFRFSSSYASTVDEQGLAACLAFKNNLKVLSSERIKQEMDKIILSKNGALILSTMFNFEILQIILPVSEFKIEIFERASKFARENNIESKLYTNYALMFFRSKNLKAQDIINLKFSKSEATKIFNIITFLDKFDINEKDFLLRQVWLHSEDYLQYILAALAYEKIDEDYACKFLQYFSKLSRPKFLINGSDLAALNILGKDIGNSLKFLKNVWIKSNFSLNKNQLIKRLDNLNEN